MPHELHASLCVVLPDSPTDMAEGLSTISSAWAEMMRKIEEAHKPTSSFAINETNRHVPPGDGAVGRRKRGRPAAGTTHAQLPVAEEV